jgi:outer membrane PBP1 activator LpoA protein
MVDQQVLDQLQKAIERVQSEHPHLKGAGGNLSNILNQLLSLITSNPQLLALLLSLLGKKSV